MARKTEQELKIICEKLNVDRLWSWSRYHCYKQDCYEYFLKYVIKKEEDRKNGIYAVSGSHCHDIIESLYSNKIEYKDMINVYEDSLLTMNIAELKYDRNDADKNEKISNKYENCMRHFFKNHIMIKQPCRIEHFITIRISEDIVLQGYIDFLFAEKYEDSNGFKRTRIKIIDWKTSTRYTGKKIDKESGQLIIYAEGIRQILGIPLEDICCEWNFLKYVTVTYEQKNGKTKDRHIERNAIGESLVNTAKAWLKHFGYNETDEYIEDMVLNNSIDCLPNEVRKKFVIKDCYVTVPLSEKKIDMLKQDIIKTIGKIKEKEQQYQKTKDENLFWQDITDADVFRINMLSGYSRKLHKPYDKYLKAKENDFNFNDENDASEKEWLKFLDNL